MHVVFFKLNKQGLRMKFEYLKVSFELMGRKIVCCIAFLKERVFPRDITMNFS